MENKENNSLIRHPLHRTIQERTNKKKA